MKIKILAVPVICLLLVLSIKEVEAENQLPTIRPLGDSITYGFGFTITEGCIPIPWINQFLCPAPLPFGGGYRAWMSQMAFEKGGLKFQTQGYQYAGSNGQQWDTGSYAHDGYPGWTNPYLSRVAQLGNTSDITLVHAGTNDIIYGAAMLAKQTPGYSVKSIAQRAQQDLFTLISNLNSANPNSKIFVALVIPIFAPAHNLNYAQAIRTEYNNLIRSNWSKLSGTVRNKTTLVDMSNILKYNGDYNYLSLKVTTPTDGVHPNYSGYAKMACTWLNAIQNKTQTPQDPCSGYPVNDYLKKMASEATSSKMNLSDEAKDSLTQK